MEQLKPGFVWTLRSRDKAGNITSEEVIHNLMPIEALDHMLDVTFKQGAQYPSFYVGLFEGNYEPSPADDMATFPANATELTAYTSGTRPTLVLGAVAGGNVDNLDNTTKFTGNTDGKSARGGFISTASAKGGTTGPLVSAVKFSTARSLNNGGTLEVLVAFQFVSI